MPPALRIEGSVQIGALANEDNGLGYGNALPCSDGLDLVPEWQGEEEGDWEALPCGYWPSFSRPSSSHSATRPASRDSAFTTRPASRDSAFTRPSRPPTRPPSAAPSSTRSSRPASSRPLKRPSRPPSTPHSGVCSPIRPQSAALPVAYGAGRAEVLPPVSPLITQLETGANAAWDRWQARRELRKQQQSEKGTTFDEGGHEEALSGRSPTRRPATAPVGTNAKSAGPIMPDASADKTHDLERMDSVEAARPLAAKGLPRRPPPAALNGLMQGELDTPRMRRLPSHVPVNTLPAPSSPEQTTRGRNTSASEAPAPKK